MRNLKYAILGLLNQQPMTGYQLMQKFEGALSEFWHAKHSQIYPELKKLASEGMVEYEVQITGTSLEKKRYRLTEAGREDFRQWLAADEPLAATPKDVFRLRLFFANELSPKKRIELLESQRRRHEDRLAQLKKNREAFGGMPPGNTESFYDYLVLKGAIMREETHCQWLQECMDAVLEAGEE